MTDQPAPAAPHHPEQGRFAQLTMATVDAAQLPVAQRVAKATGRPVLNGPFNIMLRRPGLANGMMELFEYFRGEVKLPRRLIELAILTLARDWSLQFEWFAHAPLALKAGVSEAIIADLRMGRRPAAMQPDEAIVYEVTLEFARDHDLSDATFAQAKEILGEEQLIDLGGVIGQYMAVGVILNLGKVGVPEGHELPLPPLSDR